MTRRPRREWKAFLCVPRWSVRLRIRSDRMATCTSGDPVSPDFTPYSEMTVCLRSAVIDIEVSLRSVIDHAHRQEAAVFDARQPDQHLVVPRTDDRAIVKPVEADCLTRN